MISFRIDWFDFLAFQRTFKSVLQHHSSKAPIFQCSTFFMVQLSNPYMTTGKNMALSRHTFVSRGMSLLFFFFFFKALSFPFLSAIRVVLYLYLRLLIFLLAILIPAYDSSRLAFNMMNGFKLNKHSHNTQPRCIPSPILNHSVFSCLFLTVASWHAYRFLRRQVRWSGICHLLKNFSHFVEIHTVKGKGTGIASSAFIMATNKTNFVNFLM